MNPVAILALIGDLYQQILALTEQNRLLTEAQNKPPSVPVV